jgi:hypothetical protein
MTKQEQIKDLRNQLDNLNLEMIKSFFDLEQRNKTIFLITMELEKLENPTSYNENKNHWDGYEFRF